MVIGLIKLYSERALIETIRRSNREIELLFSESGTDTLPAEEIFRALGEVPLKANMTVKKKKYSVTIQIENTHTYQWLDYLQKFAKVIATYRREKSEK